MTHTSADPEHRCKIPGIKWRWSTLACSVRSCNFIRSYKAFASAGLTFTVPAQVNQWIRQCWTNSCLDCLAFDSDHSPLDAASLAWLAALAADSRLESSWKAHFAVCACARRARNVSFSLTEFLSAWKRSRRTETPVRAVHTLHCALLLNSALLLISVSHWMPLLTVLPVAFHLILSFFASVSPCFDLLTWLCLVFRKRFKLTRLLR